jgi:hypothetical protein
MIPLALCSTRRNKKENYERKKKKERKITGKWKVKCTQMGEKYKSKGKYLL